MAVVASAGGNQLYVYGDDNANDIRVRRGDGADTGDIVVSFKNSWGNYEKVYQVSDAQIAKVPFRDARWLT